MILDYKILSTVLCICIIICSAQIGQSFDKSEDLNNCIVFPAVEHSALPFGTAATVVAKLLLLFFYIEEHCGLATADGCL